jgi:lysophospholipase L1-like esterase
MIVQNIGVSGATIAEGTTLSNGANRHWICSTIGNIDADADFVILEGGVNDASLNIPIGAITTRYTSAFDTTTFCGAFEYMLKTLTERFGDKKVGYIAVHKMATGFLSSKLLPPSSLTDAEYTQYYDAAKMACEKWGVPFLDLNTSVPPLGFFTASSSVSDELKALTAQYTLNGDGWHPNKEGYLKYYVPKIEAWLKTL